MTAFIDLPSELLTLVFEYTSKRDLVRLSAASKKWRSFLEPTIYQDLVWTRTQESSPIPLPHLLLRTFLRRPCLARHVEHIHFRDDRLRYMVLKTDQPPLDLTVEELQLGRNLIRAEPLPGPESWTQGFEQGDIHVYIALLVAQCHNLVSLDLGWQLHYDSKFLAPILGCALSDHEATTFSRFRRLRRVDLGSDLDASRYQGMGPEIALEKDQIFQTLPLFYLPAIEHLNTWMSEPQTFRWPKEPPASSNLTSLILNRSRLQAENLSRLLSCTPGLKAFTYDFWGDSGPREGSVVPSRYLECGKLDSALQLIRGSVEELVLSVGFFDSQVGENDCGGSYETGEKFGIKGTIGSLQPFQQLESLTVPFVVLLGWRANSTAKLTNMLPIGLRHLCLGDDLHWFDDYEWEEEAALARIIDFLQYCKVQTPRLESISIRSDWWEQEAMERLQVLCKEVGIDANLVPP
ncbi:MAG: hypothetical protein M1817_005801 [Caeruleum heppii]|nr:MAG: hypothetical protein M1817_005801 [Caeruleum heppii]